jgi:hypothetical protein
VEGGWGLLYKEDFHNLYYSPVIIRVIELGRMKLTGNIARIGRLEMHITVGREI